MMCTRVQTKYSTRLPNTRFNGINSDRRKRRGLPLLLDARHGVPMMEGCLSVCGCSFAVALPWLLERHTVTLFEF